LNILYAIVDIETNGGNFSNSKITEIAIFLHDGEKVIDSYCTLINCETPIPPFITRLTGIDESMIEDAPKFYEVAKEIVKFTEGAVFVAHSVNFDYNIVRSEFKNLGFDYKRETLCTVKLSRKLIPLQPSYKLGELCNTMNIQIEGRHRAGGDAEATAKLFDILLSLDAKHITFGSLKNDKLNFSNPNISSKTIEILPEGVGVYYFYNAKKEVIYIGKSKNIRKRVISHLQNTKTNKALVMKNDIADIDFVVTGSELIALLKESEEIKTLRPFYNTAQKRTYLQYGIFTDQLIDGYIRLVLNKIKPGASPLIAFTTRKEGVAYLYYLNEQHKLCLTMTGLNTSKGACFHYKIKLCNGACNGTELANEYNKRVYDAIDNSKLKMKSIFIIDKGRNLKEKSVVQLKNGKYVGFGYTAIKKISNTNGQLSKCIDLYQHNRDVHYIINNFLRNNKVEQTIEY